MMSWNMAAAGVAIPAFSADHDTISESASSATPPSPQPMPGMELAAAYYSAMQLQVAGGVAPVLWAPEEVQLVAAAAAEEEETSQEEVEDGGYNWYLHIHGMIPMTRYLDLDHNALAPPPDQPVICAYCNCAFCFGNHVVPSLYRHVYPAPPVPITLDLLTPPMVSPLIRDDPWGPGAMTEGVFVCNNEHHFMVTMGMLQQQLQPGGAPLWLLWKSTISCLRVLPIVVGSEGAQYDCAEPAPPPEPRTYAGAYWNYVKPGDEEIVKLRLHDDPLKLTLGRR